MRISDWSSDVCSSDLLLVAVVLSAQATDVGVNKATRALFRKVTTPQQMLALGEAGLKEHIRTIGQIGRASCGERACTAVSVSVVAVSLKKKKTIVAKSST